MADAITDRTRLVLVCTPNNPTGTAVRRAELERFLDRVPARRARRDRRGLPRVRPRRRRPRRARRLPRPAQRRRAAHLLQGVRAGRAAGGLRGRARAGGRGAAQDGGAVRGQRPRPGRGDGVAGRRGRAARAGRSAGRGAHPGAATPCASRAGPRCRTRRPTSSGCGSASGPPTSPPPARRPVSSSGRSRGEGARVTIGERRGERPVPPGGQGLRRLPTRPWTLARPAPGEMVETCDSTTCPTPPAPKGSVRAPQRIGAALGAGFRDGGLHPRFGTRNFVLPLANGVYLEVVAALDHPAADKAPFGQAVKARTEAGGGWLAWVIAVDDLAPLESRLGRTAVDGHRRRPDGVELTWRQIGVLDLLDDPALPFFIQWQDEPALHPAATPEGAAAPGITKVEICGDAAKVGTGSASRWPGPTSRSTGSTPTSRACSPCTSAPSAASSASTSRSGSPGTRSPRPARVPSLDGMSGAEVELRHVASRTVRTPCWPTSASPSARRPGSPWWARTGSGKSTLLALVAGRLTPRVRRGDASSPPSATVVLLPQERDRRPGETLRGYLARRTGVAAAERRRWPRPSEALAVGAAGADDAYAEALERWLALGGADLDTRAPVVLDRLGLDAGLLDRETTTLSGGQLARCGLAAILLTQVDVLLLDEPTNDLDADGLAAARVVPRAAARRPGGGLARPGVPRAAGDRRPGDRRVHPPRRAVRRRLRGLPRGARAGPGGRAGGLRGVRRAAQRPARAGPPGEGVVPAGHRAGDQRPGPRCRAGQVHPARERGERAGPRCGRRPRPAAGGPARGGRGPARPVGAAAARWTRRPAAPDDVAGLAAAVVERGGFRLGPVDLAVRRGDRIAVTGPNGSGKSTLLAALLGRLPVTSGRAWLGRSVVVGEIDQVRRTFAGRRRWSTRSGRATGQDESRGAHAAGEVRPGRRRRAAPGRDAVARRAHPGRPGPADGRRANLLVLDEPTNHLDLAAIEQLEEALGDVRRDAAAARQPRPAAARPGAHRPARPRRRRAGPRALTGGASSRSRSAE